MTTPRLIADLRADEGCRLEAYPDPLTGGSPWTIGCGHTGLEVRPGLVWTEAQAEEALTSDLAAVCRALDARLPWWRQLDDARQDVLANMAFNLGVGGLLRFGQTLESIRARRWDAAANGMLASAWAGQVGARARRLAEQMRTGARP
ncbi:MAG TPA: glycoside hydrolase family protein [Caulobacteraceae bacterium]|nr:glycoside hydrolase family protein [Caulobacteraceae bacterium]